jgi:hypothetical protein
MKTTIILLALFYTSTCLGSGTPVQKQKVYSIVKQYQSNSWYSQQLELWENEVKSNPLNAEAWLNVYSATRMLKLCNGGKTKEDMDAVADRVSKNIPNTFEGNYIQYWNGNHEEELFKYLLKAYEIDPSRAETYDDFVTYYELKRDKIQVKEFCEKWFASNDISEGLMAWNYNMLMSCDENAIIMTQGDNDTYPAWILQNAKSIRKDVTVLNMSLLMLKDYRDSYFKELGIPVFNVPDLKSAVEFNQLVCQHIQKNSSRPFYYANTVDPVNYANVKADIYSVGLAFKYSKDGFDNVAVLRKNYEKNFLKDYLRVDLRNDISQTVVDNMNGSYLLPFITLYNHYTETEEKASLENLAILVNSIAKKAGQSEEVKKIISQGENNVVSYVIKDPKEVLYGMVKINENLHASSFETSNLMYNKFLEDLLKQKRYQDLMVAKQEKIEWANLLANQYKNLTFDEYFAHGKPDDDGFPVCNVSYEATQLYCQWLTNVYNNLPGKKKQFKKVKFRLPTEKEWEALARCGVDNNFKYPWGYLADTKEGFKRDNICNQNGCFLANIQTNRSASFDPNSCPTHDGGIFPVTNSSYHPTDYGMYCMIGNVAEMVQEKGIAKGGGWNTLAEDATIQGQQKYNAPDANIGFRVIMEILEK